MAVRIVSEEICKNWDKSGKSELLKLYRNVINKSNQVASRNKDVKRIVYEMCWNSIHGHLKVEAVILLLQDFMQFHSELPSIVADILVLLDCETQCGLESRDKFYYLLNACSKKIVSENVLKERIDFETTGDAGILKSAKGSLTKFIKIKTRLFYKQQKFNLFREESEGYAKLVAELNQEIEGRVNSKYMLEVIQSLIGCFNLDPNRVLDVMLESFECNLHLSSFFITLLQSFLCNSTTLSQVLGFKFGFYQTDTTKETSSSLYRMAALLLQNELLSLEQIYYMLTPDDNKITEQHQQELQDARIYARRLTAIATSSEKAEEAKNDNKEEEKSLWQEENQKLGLCTALLEVGDWAHASMMIDRMPDFYAVSHPFIAKKLCQLIHIVIEPLYRKCSGLPSGLKVQPLPNVPSNIPVQQISSFGQLQENVLPMFFALGPYLHHDPVLLVKINRISKRCVGGLVGKKNVDKNHVQSELEFHILSLLDATLLPSMSLLECNCCIAEEIWSLVKLFPYQQRYRLYSKWKNEAHLNHAVLIRSKADTLKRIKYIMKRLSKENVKPSGRQIGKLSHSNPGFLFDYILSQIQTWDNLIGPVVDSLKYLTSLSYDMLAFCVIEALSNPEKDRVKHDGTSISLWLQSLASFCGAIFRKYPIELTGLLQLVANQLKAEKSLDLLLLKEIVQKMAGIEASDEMTNDQLEAMAGGELLRAEGGYFTQMRNTKKSSQRLKEALLEQDLALPLCLLMAQQRNCILFREQEQGHLKLVGKLYDQCQDTLVQYGSFLALSLSMDDYMRRLPPVDRLLSQYHIQADVAFYLARPMFTHSVNSKIDELRKLEKSLKNSVTVQKSQRYKEAVDSVMNPIIEAICPTPSRTCEDLSPHFYVTFWTLSMYDLHVPTSSYEREVNKLKQQISQIDENKELIQSKKKKERERCNALIEKLSEEETKQKEHCSHVMARLKNEKDSWFQSRSAKNETITQFLQLCIFPRGISTSIDALYCAKFVRLIHTLKTPNFSTLICYDRIFCDISYTVTSCTENEANRYGRFLCTMLETVMRWHSDKATFEKECTNFPGFMTKFKGPSQSSESTNDHVDYENYRHVCHKWHFRITKALVICLESNDYIQIRNSLIVLTKIIPNFPVITNLSQALERRVEKIRLEEKDKRADLFALATGYSGQLKSRKSSLIPEQEFHLKESKDASKTAYIQSKSISAGSDSKEAKGDASLDAKSESRTMTKSNSQSATRRNAEDVSKDGSGDKEDGLLKKEDSSKEQDCDSDSSNSSVPHRRPIEYSDADKGHKRRRIVETSVQPKFAQHTVESRQAFRKLKAEDHVKSPRLEDTRESTRDERSSSRERNSEKLAAQKETENHSEKQKTKDKKASRKREQSENGSTAESKRRKEEIVKSVLKRSETSETRERHRREEVSPKTHDRIRERSDREDKKHSSGSSTTSSIKKRS